EGFELRAEFFDAVFDRPGGAIGQAADGGPGHDADRVANFGQQVEIFEATAAGFDAKHHFCGPACSFAAGRALAAAFVREEAAAVEQEIDHAGLVVHNNDCCSPEAQAAEFSGAVEVERTMEFVSSEQAHADAAGNRRLRLTAFPHAAAKAVDQLG